MKKIYICGDSFSSTDAASPILSWTQQLSILLGDRFAVENLSIVCASNFLIRLQVERAIQHAADFIIMLCSSSIRGQGKINNHGRGELLDRFYQIGVIDNNNKDLACFSLQSIDETCVFSPDQMDILLSYYRDIHSLELAIMENQFIIESSLYRLRDSGIPFTWDQGGFENPNYGAIMHEHYFSEFQQWKSEKNIWNFMPRTKSHRPYFHITDPTTHNELAQYYCRKIINALELETT
jgi:hypothetical protein